MLLIVSGGSRDAQWGRCSTMCECANLSWNLEKHVPRKKTRKATIQLHIGQVLVHRAFRFLTWRWFRLFIRDQGQAGYPSKIFQSPECQTFLQSPTQFAQVVLRFVTFWQFFSVLKVQLNNYLTVIYWFNCKLNWSECKNIACRCYRISTQFIILLPIHYFMGTCCDCNWGLCSTINSYVHEWLDE